MKIADSHIRLQKASVLRGVVEQVQGESSLSHGSGGGEQKRLSV